MCGSSSANSFACTSILTERMVAGENIPLHAYEAGVSRTHLMTINSLGNTLSRITLSHEEIERQIADYELIFKDYRNSDIEWRISLPVFVTAFYDFIIKFGKIPTQFDFYKYYCESNKDAILELDLTKLQIRGLKARIYRTYPSFVRDVHFGMYLKYSGMFDDVFYNEVLDVEYGIDLVVKQNNKVAGLCLFTKTDNAQYARNKKEFRQKKHFEYECIEVPIDFKKCKKCGMFFLYGETEMREIQSNCKKIKGL